MAWPKFLKQCGCVMLTCLPHSVPLEGLAFVSQGRRGYPEWQTAVSRFSCALYVFFIVVIVL